MVSMELRTCTLVKSRSSLPSRPSLDPLFMTLKLKNVRLEVNDPGKLVFQSPGKYKVPPIKHASESKAVSLMDFGQFSSMWLFVTEHMLSILPVKPISGSIVEYQTLDQISKAVCVAYFFVYHSLFLIEILCIYRKKGLQKFQNESLTRYMINSLRQLK